MIIKYTNVYKGGCIVTNEDDKISKVIKMERIRKGWTMEKLAHESGINKNTISRIEKKITVPHDSTLGKILQALGLNVEDYIDI